MPYCDDSMTARQHFFFASPGSPITAIRGPLGRIAGLVVVVLFATNSDGADLGRRPCGPDSMVGPLRLLIPQGFFGADFRAACRRHDACYDTPGASRATCDRQFLHDMRSACAHSRFPRLCRGFAGAMHRATVRRGGDAFAKAQIAARSAWVANR